MLRRRKREGSVEPQQSVAVETRNHTRDPPPPPPASQLTLKVRRWRARCCHIAAEMAGTVWTCGATCSPGRFSCEGSAQGRRVGTVNRVFLRLQVSSRCFLFTPDLRRRRGDSPDSGLLKRDPKREDSCSSNKGRGRALMLRVVTPTGAAAPHQPALAALHCLQNCLLFSEFGRKWVTSHPMADQISPWVKYDKYGMSRVSCLLRAPFPAPCRCPWETPAWWWRVGRLFTTTQLPRMKRRRMRRLVSAPWTCWAVTVSHNFLFPDSKRRRFHHVTVFAWRFPAEVLADVFSLQYLVSGFRTRFRF